MRRYLAREELKISTVLFWFSFFLAWLCSAFPPFRYLSYMVPFFALLTVLADRGWSFGEELRPFAFILVVGLVFAPLNTNEGWKDLFFIFAGVSIAALKELPKVRMWTIFWWLLAGFVFLYGAFGDFSGGVQFDIVNSVSSFEGNYGFLFPLLVPFALYHRQYLLAAVAMAFAVLSLKRIALIAAVGAGVFALLGEKRGRWLLNAPVMLALNAFVLIADMAYSSGALDTVIKSSTGQSANQLGMGRKALHHYVVKDLIDEPLLSWMGRGFGAVYGAAERGFGVYEKVNLHSDLLKLSYEIGYVFTAVVICLMYSTKNYMVRVAFLFFNILFFTDNTLIYYFFLFFLVLMMRLEREGRLEA